ncbi:MAG: hypothetical protein F4Y37_09020 [Caldilineaceae bacterium SB0664_bin_22]|nr:hypothetical protein [Caldilineaceae bacterium SB0664_bin_22]
MSVQLEFHTVLVGEAVVVEREQYQAAMINVGPAVFDAHLGNLLEPLRPFPGTATPRCGLRAGATITVLYGNQGLGKKKARDTWREGEPGLSATARDHGPWRW